VTPALNQAEFIEETIRSILLQGYPNLEYMVVDGGSSDGTVEVIEQYSQWITYWVSEKDRGQADAINKALSRTTGDLFNWINSDDILEPGALHALGASVEHADAVAGACVSFGLYGEDLAVSAKLSAKALLCGARRVTFRQPALWLRPGHIKNCGGIDARFHFAFDWDLAVRYLHAFPKVRYTTVTLARFRLHPASKTVRQPKSFLEEAGLLAEKYDAEGLNGEYSGEIGHWIRKYRERTGWYCLLEATLREDAESLWECLGTILRNGLKRPRNLARLSTLRAINQIVRRR
jgi:glycosyltransferase involved in cell wall biosynthesis